MSSARSLDSHSEIYDENEDGLPQHSPHSFISMHESNITLANGVENVEDVAHAEGYGLNVNDSLVLKADDIARINVSDTSNIDMTKEESSIGGEDDYGEGVSEAWPDLDAALLPLQQQHIQNERAVSNPEQEPIGEDQPEVLLAQYSARLLSKWGLRESSLVTLRRMAAPAGTEAEEQLEWRSITPGNGLRLPLTANMRYVDAVSRIRPALISVQLVSLLPGHETTDPFANQLEILLEFNSDPEGTTLAESAAQMLEDSRARMRLRNTLSPRPADLLSFADMQGAARSEQCLQLNQVSVALRIAMR